MKRDNDLTSLNARAKALLAEVESESDTDAGMGEAAAMVLIGDIYSLRDELSLDEGPETRRRRKTPDEKPDWV